jgi:molybdenum cofactor cytidylyltransferase
MISAVVLAAGNPERTGQSILFFPIHGKPVLQWVLDSILATSVVEVICVVRDLAAVRANVTIEDSRLSWLVNYGTDAGQSSSVIAGLWAVDRHSDGALFVAGDQPMLGSDLINTLIDRFNMGSAPIIAPSFQGRVRNPVLIARELFSELLQLTGDHSALEFIEKNQHRVEPIQWHDAAPFMDIDDREDYERLKLLA